MMATMPYSFKVFWAPLVELYYLPSIGKRKSWKDCGRSKQSFKCL